jgi:tRNA threonylcarbamoyladenosine biosynthesis protein TsaB
MATILAIETATKVCSVALFKDAVLLDCKEEGGAYHHAERLTLFIAEVLAAQQLDYSDIDAVAVSAGPGSYTGLRIGVATAKGLCYALSIPLISIDTLSSMAAQALVHLNKTAVTSAVLCPMIDARRMEVYTALFDLRLQVIKKTAAEVIEKAAPFKSWSNGLPVYYFGDGAAKCESVMSAGNDHFFFPINNPMPSARYMGDTATRKWKLKQFENVAYFEPFYLKEFKATTPKKLI